MNDNGWSDLKEQSLYKTVHQCRSYKWMHGKSTKYYYNRDKWFGVPAIFFGAFSGIGTFANLQGAEDCNGGLSATGIVIGCVIFVGTFLTALQNFLNYNKLSERHSIASREYAIIINNIEQQLTLDYDERDEAVKFVKEINDKTNSMLMNTPDIPNTVWNNFIKDLENETLLDEIGYKIEKEQSDDSRNRNPIKVIIDNNETKSEVSKVEPITISPLTTPTSSIAPVQTTQSTTELTTKQKGIELDISSSLSTDQLEITESLDNRSPPHQMLEKLEEENPPTSKSNGSAKSDKSAKSAESAKSVKSIEYTEQLAKEKLRKRKIKQSLQEDSSFQKAFNARLNAKMPKTLAKRYEYQLDRFN